MTSKVNDESWRSSEKYMQLSAFEQQMLMSFINNSVLTVYKQWVEDGKKIPLEEVIILTNRIVLGGVKGFFKG